MSDARRAAVTAAGVVLVILGVALLAWRAIDDGSSDPSVPSTAGAPSPAPAVSDVTDAASPFASLTAGMIRVGDRDLRVVVADSPDERSQGLRGRPGPAPYEGMLFVFGEDSTAAFTMAGVPEALDIAYFDTRGRRVDELRMEPCTGTDATCPLYRASAAYRYTLETAAGEMPRGDLRVGSG